MKKKNSFTLVEILAVLAIVGILTVGTVVGVNKLWQNNRIDVCESEMRDFTTAFKSYYTDYEKLEIAPDTNYETVLSEIVELLNSKYLSCDIEVAEISADKKKVRLQTKLKEDPWNSKYEFDIYTYSGTDADSRTGLVIISSKGPDSKSSRAEYKNGVFNDDIIAIVEPNL